MDKGLNELLKWSIENSTTPSASAPDDGMPAPPSSARGPNTEALSALLSGGPSDAELMQAAMAVVTSTDPAVTVSDKLTAFDDFEQLVESLDNANNLSPLSLWTPLLSMLDKDSSDSHNQEEEAQLRMMAAWCVGTAVQNNEPCQERLLALGGIPRLVALATKEGEDKDVRRKAIYALSSAVRNYQPAMNVLAEQLAQTGHTASAKVDAGNMDAVDGVIDGLKAKLPGGTT